MQERYQRAQVQDLGSKWKLFYWDYTRTPRQRRTKSWAKSRVPSSREAQRLADQFMEPVNERNNQPHLFASDEETLQARLQQMPGTDVATSEELHAQAVRGELQDLSAA